MSQELWALETLYCAKVGTVQEVTDKPYTWTGLSACRMIWTESF